MQSLDDLGRAAGHGHDRRTAITRSCQRAALFAGCRGHLVGADVCLRVGAADADVDEDDLAAGRLDAGSMKASSSPFVSSVPTSTTTGTNLFLPLADGDVPSLAHDAGRPECAAARGLGPCHPRPRAMPPATLSQRHPRPRAMPPATLSADFLCVDAADAWNDDGAERSMPAPPRSTQDLSLPCHPGLESINVRCRLRLPGHGWRIRGRRCRCCRAGDPAAAQP